MLGATFWDAPNDDALGQILWAKDGVLTNRRGEAAHELKQGIQLDLPTHLPRSMSNSISSEERK
jgi:hypothetical protein